MEDILTPVTPEFKLYRERTIFLGTFLGGPAVAGYLIAENFKKFGHPDKARLTWIIAIIATFAIFGGILLIPESVHIPNYLIPILYAVIAQSLVKHFQGQDIDQHVKDGGSTYSPWRAVWIGLVGLIVTLIVIIPFAFLTTTS
jgi:hypothetical protein